MVHPLRDGAFRGLHVLRWFGESGNDRPTNDYRHFRAEPDPFRDDLLTLDRLWLGHQGIAKKAADLTRSSSDLTREQAKIFDEQDPLASFRERFVIQEGVIYMDGNSLGRLPVKTQELVASTVSEEWGKGLVRSWHSWIDLASQVGASLAPLIGAASSEVILSDSTSVNLYKLAIAALRHLADRPVIISDRSNFPSDLYVLQGVASVTGAELHLIDCDPIEGPSVDDVRRALTENQGRVGLVTFSHVNYRSASIADMRAITSAVHAEGALVLWDLCHSAGAVPLDLDSCDVDLAVGCTYKYLNGGPGAPAFLFVRQRLQGVMSQPIWGWFGKKDQFDFSETYEPADGIGRFVVGTPPILSLRAAGVGIELIAEAGIDAIRAKSEKLTAMMVDLFDERLALLGLGLATPRAPSRRGSHVSIQHDDAYRICSALIENHSVIPDFRAPDVIRFGVPPIYTRFVDAWDAMDRLSSVVEAREYEAFAADRSRVT